MKWRRARRSVWPRRPFPFTERRSWSRPSRLSAGRKSSSFRLEGDWKKCAGRESGLSVRAAVYNISFHVNTDSSSLIGTDTFVNNEVTLRRGPVYLCAEYGGFGVMDEINMAKNDAVSVLHATLDHRRIIDVPGYDKIRLHPAARFIGTMNYGYAGTKELNEALVSRFLVIDMPPVDEETLMKIFRVTFPDGKPAAMEQFAGLFLDLQLKASNGEITTRPLDLRGLLAAMKTMRSGLKPSMAVKMGITNKTFDIFEKEIIGDVVMTRIPDSWTAADVFEG